MLARDHRTAGLDLTKVAGSGVRSLLWTGNTRLLNLVHDVDVPVVLGKVDTLAGPRLAALYRSPSAKGSHGRALGILIIVRTLGVRFETLISPSAGQL